MPEVFLLEVDNKLCLEMMPASQLNRLCLIYPEKGIIKGERRDLSSPVVCFSKKKSNNFCWGSVLQESVILPLVTLTNFRHPNKLLIKASL